ncbi:hypothetical protein HYALB_00013382 [Hymenoscyphus albidus]|uniref:Uncharacterized protein n=1 Tax=Hymenoscyphus albidus TaxID=595503 RepID=A0A9N9LUF4_9HELO|nr:hypothetical protein HYALB_00013382 [Hymenoscyphus albidus]
MELVDRSNHTCIHVSTYTGDSLVSYNTTPILDPILTPSLFTGDLRRVLVRDPDIERILDDNDDNMQVSATDFSLFKRKFFMYYPDNIDSNFDVETLIDKDYTPQPVPVETTESVQLLVFEPVESTATEFPVQQTDQPCPMESTPICAVSAEWPVSVEAPESAPPGSPQLSACESPPDESPVQQIDQPCPIECTPICASESPRLPACESLPAKSPVPTESPRSLESTVATALFCTLFSNRHVPIGMELLALVSKGGGG